MSIVIHLGNQLIGEAVCQLLAGTVHDDVIADSSPQSSDITPEVFLVDVATLNDDLIARYPYAKFLLLDTGLEREKIAFIFLTYKIQGVLSPRTDLRLLKKAIETVRAGRIWIDDEVIKSSFERRGVTSNMCKISGLTDREKQIISHMRQGLSNKEIGKILGLTEGTVKTHTRNIFAKLSIRKRANLIALVTDYPPVSVA